MPTEMVNVDNEYLKFPEMKREEVLKLVDWVRHQPHLPNLDEAVVILFYHACNYSTEQTKSTIDIHYTTRTHCPEFFKNWDPLSPVLEKVMKTVTVIPLDKATPEGYKVILAKLSDFDPSNFNFNETMKLYTMVFDLLLYREGIQAGHLMVMDMTGCSLGHVARLGLMTMKKFLFFVQEAAAIRLKGFHYINIVPFMDKILALMTPFMKKELKSMLYIHSDMDSFYKFVPQKIMPAEYGGCEEQSSILREIVYQKVREHRDKYLESERIYIVDEKLRPGKPKSASTIFGIEGNFKKLDFD